MSERDSGEASKQLWDFLWPGALAAQSLYVAAKLGLADHLAAGPSTVEELAEATHTHAPSLLRLLRALASLGLFTEEPAARFALTPLGATLRTDRPDSLHAWAIFLGAPFMWRAWGELLETVTTARPAIDRIHGAPLFSHLATHPEDAAIFNAAMSSGSRLGIPAILAAYDFSSFSKIVDLGGGQGELLSAILAANPRARGVLFDLPGVVADAELPRTPSLAGRCEVVGGDFFAAVPEGGDLYLLKNILHDWNDADALAILASARRVARADGTLLVIDTILRSSSEANPGSFMDVLMMVLTGGRERTEEDFRRLLAEAGFAVAQVIPTQAPPSIVVCKPR